MIKSRNNSRVDSLPDNTEYDEINNNQNEFISNWLEPNHSHFLLVKEKQNSLNDFRVNFEKSFIQTSPILLIVLNGDFFTLKHVNKAIIEKIPVLIIAGTKGCADISVEYSTVEFF
jgi:hypothetical protein